MWRDNDPRQDGKRLVTVDYVTTSHAHVTSNKGRRSRIHLSKFGRIGQRCFTLVAESRFAEDS